ncbi:hypothetical protein [Streptomyces sp. NPDC046197]|uniref:hypothetical protein n=1 Tax=Streptomyces sp. NPDC046197 TaxID=3154337 RepID=UPI0033C106EC
MARRESFPHPTARRALVTLATAGVALGAGATAATADILPLMSGAEHRPVSLDRNDTRASLRALTGSAQYVTGPVTDLKPNPLADTGSDPFSNSVATEVADFQPMDSRMVTSPVAEAPTIGSIPGQLAGRTGDGTDGPRG